MKASRCLLRVGLLLALFALLIPLASAHPNGTGGEGKGRGSRLPEGKLQAIAEEWGIDVETLKEKLQSGQKLPEIAEELGIEPPEGKEGKLPPVHNKANKPPKFKVMELLAEELGITQEEIGSRYAAGESVPEIAASYGLDFKTWVQSTFPLSE